MRSAIESMPRDGSIWTDIIGGVEISLQGNTPGGYQNGGCVDFDVLMTMEHLSSY